MPIERIVSGGQTGVDRAALDVALERGVACGGWCPRGRRAEDGVIPERYPLRETGSDEYAERTRLNVRDSGGTLIITRGIPDGGTALTVELAGRLGKPCRVVDLDARPDPRATADWIEARGVRVLNVAGPRESRMPGIGAAAAAFLERLLDPLPGG